jgi:hypothetical protein
MAFKSTYALGCSCMSGDVETDWLPWAAEIDAATQELSMKIQGLNTDIKNLRVSESFRAQWFDYTKLFVTWRDSGWFNSWKRRDELLNFRRRFNDFHAALKSQSNDMVTSPYDKRSTSKDGGNEWAPIAKTGLVVVGVLAGAYALGQITGFAKTVKGG